MGRTPVHSQRAGTFAVIVAGEVSASVFVLTNTNGDTVASLGTGFYSTLLVPTFGLTLQHNDTTMTPSGLDWTFRNPAITVPSAVSEETVILRGPLVTGSNTAPRVEIKSKSTPGDIEGHVTVYSGARNAIDVAATIDVGYANADSFIIETADVIYVQPQDHIELQSFRTALYLADSFYGTGGDTGNRAGPVQVGLVAAAKTLVAGDIVMGDATSWMQQVAAALFSGIGWFVNGVQVGQMGEIISANVFDTHPAPPLHYTAPASGAYTFELRMVVQAGGTLRSVESTMRLMVFSAK